MNISELDENKYDKYFNFKHEDDIFFGRTPVGEDIFEKIPQLYNEIDEEIIEKTINDNKIISDQDDKKKETIMDVKMGDIFMNLTNVIINFWPEYKKMLVKVKLEYDDLLVDNKDRNIIYLLKIHCITLVRYLQDEDNCIYMGIFLIIISILLYFINIIR
uniref:Uncharacterized protein n=1 Tax=viral metagenome TaxID=1070528 RepID=A0A6C0CXE2_9ZZZZ